MSGLVSNSTWQKLGQNLDFTKNYQRMKRKMLKEMEDLKRQDQFKKFVKTVSSAGCCSRSISCIEAFGFQVFISKAIPIVQHYSKLTANCWSHFVKKYIYLYIYNICPWSLLQTDSCIRLSHIPQTGPTKPCHMYSAKSSLCTRQKGALFKSEACSLQVTIYRT